MTATAITNDDSTSLALEWPTRRRTSPGLVAADLVSGDKHTPTLSTSGTRATGSAPQLATRGSRPSTRAATADSKSRQEARVLFQSCLANVDRALDHAHDFFLRNNALEHAKDSLCELWNLRSRREEPFGEIVNLLQVAFLERDAESFPDHQLAALRHVFERLADATELDDELANSVTVELLQGGIDVFRELD